MIDRYDAFISYKHEELDSAIAAHVQKQLEHFHIPKSIQKATGKKKINRIFRDKDELPITSSLSETISHALACSEYLIVICSTKTHESIWVDREIRTFLENHDKSHVLTVLADGEPSEVIPQILLTQEVTYTDQFGNYETRIEPIEPLSCDYRIGKKEASKIEIPRLAATLIGCSYDELINRSRQYAMKRMTGIMAAIVALSIGFGGYMFYSKTRVNEAYLEAQKSQSRVLANESRNMLEDERRIIALQLALAALPDEKHPDRPVTAEAVRALADATLAYEPSNSFNYAAYYSMQMPNAVKEISPAKSGKYLVACDEGNIVTCFRPYLQQEIMTINSDGTEVKSVNAINDDIFVVVYRNRIDAYNVSTTEKIWTYTIEDAEVFDGTCLVTDDNALYVGGEVGFYAKISLEDGSELDQFILADEDTFCLYYYDYCLSPDNSKLAFAIFCSDISYKIGIYDFNTKKLSYSQSYDTMIKDISWPREDRIYAAFSDMHTDEKTGKVDSHFSLVIPSSNRIVLFNPENLYENWSYSFESSGRILGSEIIYYEVNDTLVYYIGNIGLHLDAQTGKEIGIYDTNDIVISCINPDKNGEPLFITYSGNTVMPYNAGKGNSISTFKLTSGHTTTAKFIGGLFTVRENDNEVIGYMVNIHDDAFNIIEDDITPAYISKDLYTMDDNLLAFFSSKGVALYNVTDKLYLGTAPYPEDFNATDELDFIGSYDKYIFFNDLDKDKNLLLYTIDTEQVKITKEVLQSDYPISTPMCRVIGDKLLYYTLENKSVIVHQKDIESGQTLDHVFQNLGSSICSPSYLKEEDLVYIGGNSDTLIDMKTGTETIIPYQDDYQVTLKLDYDPERKLILRSDTVCMELCDLKGNVLRRIDHRGASIIGCSIYKNYIIVGCEDASLYKYSIKDGSLCGKTDLTIDSITDEDEIDENTPLATLTKTKKSYSYEMIPDYDNNLAFIQVGFVTNIIDMDSFYEITSIDKSFGYNKNTDTFIGFSEQSQYIHQDIGYYKHYTLEELIEDGKNSLNGAELSPELKAKYGIK